MADQHQPLKEVRDAKDHSVAPRRGAPSSQASHRGGWPYSGGDRQKGGDLVLVKETDSMMVGEGVHPKLAHISARDRLHLDNAASSDGLKRRCAGVGLDILCAPKRRGIIGLIEVGQRRSWAG